MTEEKPNPIVKPPAPAAATCIDGVGSVKRAALSHFRS